MPSFKLNGKMTKGRILIIVSILIVLILVVMRISKPQDEMIVKELPNVSTGHIERGDIQKETSLIGTINPSGTYYVTPKVSGEILEIYVKNGDSVKKGDPIALIDNQKTVDAAKSTLDSAQFSLQAAEESLSTAEDALRRMTPLYEAGDISEQTYLQTKNSANAAKAQRDALSSQVESARLNYDTQVEYSTVTSPQDGEVQNTDMSLYTTVSQANTLCLIKGRGNKKINFSVTEDVMPYLSLDDEIHVEKNGLSYTGSITKIGEMTESQTGLYPVEAELKDAEKLTDGVSCKIRLNAAHRENVLLLPVDAVYYSAGDPYVYVYNGETAEKREVTLGISNNEYYELIDGITEDDDLIISWTDEIYDGAIVNVIDESEEDTETESSLMS